MARLRFGRPISLRWNGLLLEGPALTVFEIPDEYYEEFNQDIGPVEPTLVWLDSDEGATLRARVTTLEAGGGGASLSNDAALALGTAAAGTGTEASRDDHVHPTTGLALSSHNHSGVYDPAGTASSAISTHVGESDPHTQYLTETAASSTYSTTSHNHSGVYDPAGTASSAISTHVGESDPHTQYLTETAASSTYSTTSHNHSGVYEPVNTAILKSVVDAKGDLIVGTAADTVDRLPGSGTNGYVLTYDSAETTGLKWAAAPSSGGGASVGTATPLALGTASAGDDATASREDHVHPTTGLALSSHNHDAAYSATGHNHSGVYEVAGAVSTHVGESDPHTQYLTETSASSTYAPTASPTFTGTVTTPLTTAGIVKTTSGGVLSSTASIAQSESHSSADTDSATSSLHHTIGTSATQAAAGNHGHTGMVTTSDTGTVTSTMIADGTIVNADVNASAEIALTKLASITAGSVLMGNASNVPTATALSGDVTVNSSGVTAIGSGVIVNADINASAAIADTKLATISTASKVSNSATTATSSNTASAIVARDASGNFSAGAITATDLTLNAQGDVRFADSDSSNWVALQAPATVSSNVTWTLPSADGTANQVLSTNGTGTLSWATAGGSLSLTQNQQTGTTYTLAASDLNKLVELNNAAAITVTVPANILAAGDQIHIMQTGAGQVTVAAGSNVSAVNSALGLKLRTQWSSATLIKRVTSNNADVWVLVGDTTT